MSKKAKYMCGVPQIDCEGGFLQTDQKFSTSRCHSSPSEAFSCHRNYLLKSGYKQIGGREFSPPDNGPVLVLTKRIRFGGKMRGGKEGRFMPEHGSGLIIG